VQRIRKQVALMELETQRFYSRAVEQATDAGLRQLLGDLAAEERRHETFPRISIPTSKRSTNAKRKPKPPGNSSCCK